MTEKIARGNDPVEKTKVIERNYLVCDGCGYIIGWAEPRSELKIQEIDSLGHVRISDLMHFHYDPVGNARQCLTYWLGGRKAREEREKKESELLQSQ